MKRILFIMIVVAYFILLSSGVSGQTMIPGFRDGGCGGWKCVSATSTDYQYPDCKWLVDGKYGISCGESAISCDSYCGGSDKKQLCTYASSTAKCKNTCSEGYCKSCIPSCGNPSCSYVEGECGYKTPDVCVLSLFSASNINPYSQSSYPGSTKKYSFTITNNDKSYCSSKTFILSARVPQGFGYIFSPSSLTLNPGAQGTVEVSVTSPSSASGSYTFSLSVTDGKDTIVKDFALSVATPKWSLFSKRQIEGACASKNCFTGACDLETGYCGYVEKACQYGCNPTTGNCYPCPSGQTLCNGVCVNLQTDKNNCGLCGNVCPTQAPTYSNNYCSGGNIVKDKTTYSSSCSGGSCINTPSTTVQTVQACQYGCNPTTVSCYAILLPTISITPKNVSAGQNQEVKFSVTISNPNTFSHYIKIKTPKMYDNNMNENTQWGMKNIMKYADSNNMDVMEENISFAPSSSNVYSLFIKIPQVSTGSKVRVKAIAEGSLVDDIAEIIVVDTTPPSVSVIATPFPPCTLDATRFWIDCSATISVGCSDADSGCTTGSYGYKVYDSNPGTCPSSKSYYISGTAMVAGNKWACAYAEDNVGNGAVSSPAEIKVNKTFTILVAARAYGDIDVPAGTEVKAYLCEPSQYFCNHDVEHLASGSGIVGADKKFRITLSKELEKGQKYKVGIVTEKGYAESEFVA